MKKIKQHLLLILLVIGGILDQTTDLLVQLITELNAPNWTATLLRILIISLGAFRLYYSTSPNSNKDGDTDIGGGGIKNPKP